MTSNPAVQVGEASRNGAPLLSLSGITKRYPTVVANENIDLDVSAGEIHAVLGENGAGKSTLMKIIFGVAQPDAGTIYWQGHPVRIDSPAHARELGISMVFQHFSLFEAITVAENISLTVPGTLKELSRRIRETGQEFGLKVEPAALVCNLSVGQRQRVEIIRCLLQEPKLLILDEPTSVLPPPNVEQLFETLRRLVAKGMSILYISHKLEEIRSLCHSATILRQGRVSGHVIPAETSSHALASLMIGRDLPKTAHPPARQDGAVRLRVANLSSHDPDPHIVNIDDLSLEVRSGEILGIAGVSGNGQHMLSKMLSGEEVLAPSEKHRIELMGTAVAHENAGRRRNLGLSFVPEERLGRGAVPPFSLADNSLLTGHRMGMTGRGMVRNQPRDAFTDQCIADMNVVCAGSKSNAASLSGGNLQKFIVGREIMMAPKVLVIAQPTWGIDVGAAAMVRQKLVDLRDTGTAILLISEELEELFEISDRIVVMFKGRASPALDARATDAETIGRMMIGDIAAPLFSEAAQ